MHIQLWPFRLERRHLLREQRKPQRPAHKNISLGKTNSEKAQVLVIFAFAVFALAAFMGLAIDAASIYLTHARLKRAVDAAAVSAANDIKREQDLAALVDAATESLQLHNVDMSAVNLHVYNCDVVGLATLAPDFDAVCPKGTQAKKKLIYIDATQAAPLYFMQLLGFEQIPVFTYSISEAAPIDLVIVIDTSESMANKSVGYSIGNYDPDEGGCNTTDTCYPLKQAKEAAKALVDVLYSPYDRVGLITYDVQAYEHGIDDLLGNPVALSENYVAVEAALDAIQLHDDPPFLLIHEQRYRGYGGLTYDGPVFNPIFPDDRDGDGLDEDTFGGLCGPHYTAPQCCDPTSTDWELDLWDNTKNTSWGWGGFPCDRDDKLDVYDFNGNGYYDEEDTTKANDWLASGNSFSINSTCVGCGIRKASNILKAAGRPNAVWIIVFLSDGIANMSDIPSLANTPGEPEVIPSAFPNGLCMQEIDEHFTDDPAWLIPWCVDTDVTVRYCIDTDPASCPDGSIPTTPQLGEYNYTVYDWAMDMIDDAALSNPPDNEPSGNDIAIYSIGLGDAGTQLIYGTAVGEQLLRYMAAVGDDGDRDTDPCDGVAKQKNCGQYYFAPDGDGLKEVFEDIAGRIYTRISQ